jgi:hypothetical protein
LDAWDDGNITLLTASGWGRPAEGGRSAAGGSMHNGWGRRVVGGVCEAKAADRPSRGECAWGGASAVGVPTADADECWRREPSSRGAFFTAIMDILSQR